MRISGETAPPAGVLQTGTALRAIERCRLSTGAQPTRAAALARALDTEVQALAENAPVTVAAHGWASPGQYSDAVPHWREAAPGRFSPQLRNRFAMETDDDANAENPANEEIVTLVVLDASGIAFVGLVRRQPARRSCASSRSRISSARSTLPAAASAWATMPADMAAQIKAAVESGD